MSIWKGKEGSFQRQLFVFSKMFANTKPHAPSCETKKTENHSSTFSLLAAAGRHWAEMALHRALCIVKGRAAYI